MSSFTFLAFGGVDMGRMLTSFALVAAGIFTLLSTAECAPQSASQQIRQRGHGQKAIPAIAQNLFHDLRKLEHLQTLNPIEAGNVLGVRFANSSRKFLVFERTGHFRLLENKQFLYPGDPLGGEFAQTSAPTSRTITIGVSADCNITSEMAQQCFGKPTRVKRISSEVDDYVDGRTEFFSATHLVYERPSGVTEFIAVESDTIGPRASKLGNVITSVRICNHR